MSNYTRVVIEADSRGRLSINALDEKGLGHGHRLRGPKFCGCCPGDVVATVTLDAGDVKAIREYLAIWDEMQAKSGEVTP